MRIKKWVVGAMISLMMIQVTVKVVRATNDFAFPDVRSPILHDAVQLLRQKGVLSGYPDGTFKPDNPINRAEAVKMIFAIAGISASSDRGERSFSDVPVNTWYAKYVSAAKAKGIVRGYAGNVFRGQQEVNRVEFIKMALLAQPFYKSPPIPDLALSQFEDIESGAWYVPFVSYGLHLQFLDEINRFHPAEPMTRGDAAIFMARIQKYRDEHPELLLSDTETCATCVQGIDVSKEFPELAFHPLVRFHQGRLYIDGDDNSNALLSKRNIINLLSFYELQHLLRTTSPEDKIRIIDSQYSDEYQRLLEIHNGYQSGDDDYLTYYRDDQTNELQQALVRGEKPIQQCQKTTCKLEFYFLDHYARYMSVRDPPDWRTIYLYLPDPTKPMTFDDYRRSKFAKMVLFDLIKDTEYAENAEKKISELR